MPLDPQLLVFGTKIASGNFTRPNDTTAYSSGDLVANSTTSGSVVPIQLDLTRVTDAPAAIHRIRLNKSGSSLINASFRIHLFNASPAPANGDNGVFSTDKALNHIGYADVTLDQAFTDGAQGIVALAPQWLFRPDSGTRLIYALIEARADYTPVAQEIFTVTAEARQD